MSTAEKLNLPPLEPWQPSSVLRDAVSAIRDDLERLRADREILIFLLHDEFMENGGRFQSTEADCVFRQRFGRMDESTINSFTRLMRNKPTTLND